MLPGGFGFEVKLLLSKGLHVFPGVGMDSLKHQFPLIILVRFLGSEWLSGCLALHKTVLQGHESRLGYF